LERALFAAPRGGRHSPRAIGPLACRRGQGSMPSGSRRPSWQRSASSNSRLLPSHRAALAIPGPEAPGAEPHFGDVVQAWRTAKSAASDDTQLREATDAPIDDLVFEHYRLTADERAMLLAATARNGRCWRPVTVARREGGSLWAHHPLVLRPDGDRQATGRTRWGGSTRSRRPRADAPCVRCAAARQRAPESGRRGTAAACVA
jgi:hypothetical protein